MYPYYYDNYYFIGYMLVIIASMFMLFAQIKVQSTFKKYSKVESKYQYTGYQVARSILDQHGLTDVAIEITKRGQLSDHYDPRNKTVYLSNQVYNNTSISSISVAAHEVGHALQDSEEYAPLKIRAILVPIASIGSQIGWFVLLIGFLLSAMDMALIGVALLSLTLLFQIVTLPVEFNASRRAISVLGDSYLYSDEVAMSKKVLSAAALTYVASTLATLMSNIRLLLIIFGNKRRD